MVAKIAAIVFALNCSSADIKSSAEKPIFVALNEGIVIFSIREFRTRLGGSRRSESIMRAEIEMLSTFLDV
jgi:hypothetical protein